MLKKHITLIGLFRTGTNYARTLIENNFHARVDYNTLGWKHGPIPTYTIDSGLEYPETRILLVTRNPLATLVSWHRYIFEKGDNLFSECDCSTLSSFLRAPIRYHDKSLKVSPEYLYSSPVDMWCSITWNHLSFCNKNDGHVSRYEDLCSSPETSCDEIADHFDLERFSSSFIRPVERVANMNDRTQRTKLADYLRETSNSSQYLFQSSTSYASHYTDADLDFVASRLHRGLLAQTGYTIERQDEFAGVADAKNSTISDITTIPVFTVASDGRLSDLAVLAESIAEHDCYQLHVIPFDENDTYYTRKLCDLYGVNVEEPLKDWDQLGKFFFANKDHKERGEGIKAWRYFRKFNCISLSEGQDFLFVDANSIILSNINAILSGIQQADIVFGHRSAPRRNFAPWAKFLISKFNPQMGEGFGAGFWLTRGKSLREETFAEMARYPGLKSMLSIAPEQSVLNLAVAITGLQTKLVRECGQLCYCMIGATAVDIYANGDGPLELSHNNLLSQVYAAKWTGDYHSGRQKFNNREIHRPFAVKSLAKTRPMPDLNSELMNRFIDIYNYPPSDLFA